MLLFILLDMWPFKQYIQHNKESLMRHDAGWEYSLVVEETQTLTQLKITRTRPQKTVETIPPSLLEYTIRIDSALYVMLKPDLPFKRTVVICFAVSVLPLVMDTIYT